jgi:hypothetical protein
MPNTPRVVTGENQDTTGRTITQDYQAPVYAATLAIVPTKQFTCFNVGQLTGAMTVNATVTNMYIGDEVTFLLAADGTNRIVTFGTNFVSSGTVTVTASKKATVKGVFDGTAIRICSREITA